MRYVLISLDTKTRDKDNLKYKQWKKGQKKNGQGFALCHNVQKKRPASEKKRKGDYTGPCTSVSKLEFSQTQRYNNIKTESHQDTTTQRRETKTS